MLRNAISVQYGINKIIDEVDSLSFLYGETTHLKQLTELEKRHQAALKDAEITMRKRQNLALAIAVGILLLLLLALGYLLAVQRRQRAIIARQNALNEQVIHILSHEIKEPLLGVSMLLQRLNIADEALARVSGSLKEQIRAVNSLMVNLLKIRKLSAISRKKETTLVAPVVQQVLEQNQRALAEKQLRVEVEIGQEATLPVDKEVLRVVLQNVLSNALKFSHAGGEIQVGWEAGALLIRDFGPGMAPALAARLTREAVPAADGTRNEQGSGMGLYLIGQLLHDSGIRLAFEAPKGGGTQVRIVPARP